MTLTLCTLLPDTPSLLPDTPLLYPDGWDCTAVSAPGGGGYGAVMSNAHFARYEVDGKWRGVKRVRAPKRGS